MYWTDFTYRYNPYNFIYILLGMQFNLVLNSSSVSVFSQLPISRSFSIVIKHSLIQMIEMKRLPIRSPHPIYSVTISYKSNQHNIVSFFRVTSRNNNSLPAIRPLRRQSNSGLACVILVVWNSEFGQLWSTRLAWSRKSSWPSHYQDWGAGVYHGEYCCWYCA